MFLFRLLSPQGGKLIIACVFGGAAFSAASEDLFSLPLDQLLNIKVSTGQLVAVNQHESASAVTVIRRDLIELSSAKNLAELLEIYVPGLMVMAHSEGNKIGLRGNIAAENYKLLLLLNGKNITNMVYEGAMLELDQWDMSDIEKVEVVRGPGSVAYGTGAIAGVINIITKGAGVKDNTSLNVSYNPTYRSEGFNLQGSRRFGNLNAYFFGSYRSTEGLEDPKYYLPDIIEPSDSRFLGERERDEFGPQAYLGDSFGRPQVKMHLDLTYGDDFKLFSRYTQSGQLHHFRTKVAELDSEGNTVGEVDSRKVSLRSFIVAPEYTTELGEYSNLKSAITYDSQEYIRYDQANLMWPEEHPNNVKDYAFSQNRINASFMYSYEKAALQLTTGYEFENINVAAPWGENEDHIMVREGIYLISNEDTSVYTQDLSLRNRPGVGRTEEIGNGLDFVTHSHLIEVNYSLNDSTVLHYGHRLDFPDVSSEMYSPRLSLSSKSTPIGYVSLTAQRALRMMPLRAQYLYDKYGERKTKEHEKIDSLEFAHSIQPSDSSSIATRIFYNDIDAVGFTGVDLRFLGNLKLGGLELDAQFKKNGYELMFNHSYLKPLAFTMNEELKTGAVRNNISFSDYYHQTRGDVPILLKGYGDGINNWSENTTKLILTKYFQNERLALHMNAQIYWDYEGSYDEVGMYRAAYDDVEVNTLSIEDQASFETQRAEFEHEVALLDDQGAYQTQVNVGASVSYLFDIDKRRKIKASLFIQNLTGPRYRYYVSTGSSQYYNNRLQYMEEPTVIGLNLKISQ